MPRLTQKLITRFDLVGWSALLSLPGAAALLARELSRTIDRKSNHTVLCIGRPIFNEDIEEMAKFGGTLNYVIVPKIVFMQIFSHFLPKLLLNHAKYHEVSGYETAKLRCRSFFEDFLAEFGKATKFHAILTANYNYSWQQELAAAARKLGIPFLVLFKEGISPLFAEGVSVQQAYDLTVTKYTNNFFIGDKLLVYNDRIKQGFTNAQISGIRPEIVEAVGIPRFDRYFHLEGPGSSILFFSFNFEDKSRHLGLPAETFEKYQTKTREFHIEVVRFAAAHPELRIVIKTKNNRKYLRYVNEIVEEAGYTGLANITLTNSDNVYDLISDARAVIGYNSTALLEAFAARRIVISPDFRWGSVRDYFDEYPSLPNYVETAQDIAAVLVSGRAALPLDDPQLLSLLHERIHIPDGRASKRAEAAIEQAISMHRSTREGS